MLADATAGQPILGVTGGGLGFSGNKGLAVALDTYHNQVNPSANFVGVATGAGPSPDTLTWGATATNVASLRGTPVHVSVTTTTSGLNVTVNGAQVITYTGTIPSNVYVGFTGGTGGLTDRHAVENVAITAGPVSPPVSVQVLGMYLGDNSRTGITPGQTGINSSNAGTLTTKWTAATGPASAKGNFAAASAQPIVVGGVAYWGDWNGNEHATNVTTGADQWSTSLGVTDDTVDGCVPQEAGVSSTATVGTVGGKTEVFVAGGNATYYALDGATGAILWQTTLGASPAHFIWGSPIIVNGNIYIGISSFGDCPLVHGAVAELDAGTGLVKSVFYADGQNGTSACLGADVTSSPAYDATDDSLYITTGNADCGLALGEAIVKISASSMALIASWQVPTAQAPGDSDFVATPTLFTGTIAGSSTPLVGAVNKNGVFYALRRSSIAAGPVWQTTVAELGDCPQCQNGGSSIVPAVFDGTDLYLGGGTVTIGTTSSPGSLVALDPSTGAVVWQDPEAATVVAPGTPSGDVIAFGDIKGTIHVVLKASGAQVATYTVPGPIYGPVTIDSGVMYVATGAGTLMALG